MGNENHINSHPATFFLSTEKETFNDSLIGEHYSKKDQINIQTLEERAKWAKVILMATLFATNTHILPEQEKLNEVYKRQAIRNRRKNNHSVKFCKHSEITTNETTLELFTETVKNISAPVRDTHRELLFQHKRTSFWKKVRYGKGLQYVKYMKIAETTVRPDLPKKEIA